eukprot:scaffold69475_cov69-Phaeocystis_antarctica.AAC.3
MPALTKRRTCLRAPTAAACARTAASCSVARRSCCVAAATAALTSASCRSCSSSSGDQFWDALAMVRRLAGSAFSSVASSRLMSRTVRSSCSVLLIPRSPTGPCSATPRPGLSSASSTRESRLVARIGAQSSE